MPTDEELLAQLSSLEENITGLRATIDEENVKRDRRIRLSRILIALVLIVSAVALYVGWYGVNQQN